MGLRLQFILPVIVVLAGALAGRWLGAPGIGVAAGGVAAIGLGLGFAIHARRRLEDLGMVLSIDPEILARRIDAAGSFDEIDSARSNVFRALELERSRVERERAEADRQARLLDRLSDGVMLVAEDGEVIYANVAAATLVGGRNPIGRSFIVAVRDYELTDALFNCLRTGQEHRHSLEAPGDGRLVDAIVARVSDSPPQALVLMRDVTELTRLQTLRRDFVANVSHELRTPLSTIKILTETLLDLSEETSEEREFLEKIDAEVDSMTELVGDLLQLTQLESGRAPLMPSRVSSATLLEDVLARMSPIAERQRVRLEVDEDAEPFDLVADERRMKQALMNLVQNAIVHTPAGGWVRISARLAGDRAHFSVRDSGVGIPADDLERIWERFYKVDRSRSHPGTGLGLAIVKHVVQAHGGMVRASSRVGEGSTFKIEIPVEPAGSKQPAPTT